MRYSKKDDSPYVNLSCTIRKDLVEEVTIWQHNKKIRNRSVAVEQLLIQGLHADGIKI